MGRQHDILHGRVVGVQTIEEAAARSCREDQERDQEPEEVASL